MPETIYIDREGNKSSANQWGAAVLTEEAANRLAKEHNGEAIFQPESPHRRESIERFPDCCRGTLGPPSGWVVRLGCCFIKSGFGITKEDLATAPYDKA